MSTDTYIWTLAPELKKLADEKLGYPRMSEEVLAKIARDYTKHVAELKVSARQSSETALVSALRAGYVLQELQKQKTSERQWTGFMKKELPEISQASIYRYIGLAERFPDPKCVPKNLTLCKAYELSGIIEPRQKKKKTETSPASSPESTREDLAERFASMTNYVRSFVDGGVAEKIIPTERAQVAAEVDALMTILAQFRKSLSASSAEEPGESTATADATPAGRPSTNVDNVSLSASSNKVPPPVTCNRTPPPPRESGVSELSTTNQPTSGQPPPSAGQGPSLADLSASTGTSMPPPPQASGCSAP